MNKQEENLFLQNCSDDDALAFSSGMFKAGKLREKLWLVLINSIASNLYTSLKEQGVDIDPGYIHTNNSVRTATWKWFKQGIECETLKISSQGWQKGKIKLKVCLEFIPDEPESSQTDELEESVENKSVLDDIRQSII
jgi:hypothetical protein